MSEKFRIGRMPAVGPAKHVLDIRRDKGGGVKISNIDGLTDTDRTLLFRHFGSPKTARAGGTATGKDGESYEYTTMETEDPGTEKHFRMAVLAMPRPFILMG